MSKESSSILRRELERNLRNGRCAYCRRPAAPDEPLTREHVIPRARGGRRRDVRVIIPACARCNHRRGCQDLALFLVLRPRRISALLDYLGSLSTDGIRQMDLRLFAELYAALWLLDECSASGRERRDRLRRVCTGRALHRRRYAARRVVGAVGERLEHRRERQPCGSGPSCLLLPSPTATATEDRPGETLQQQRTRLLNLLSRLWHVPAEEVLEEVLRQRGWNPEGDGQDASAEPPELDRGVLPLDGWARRRRRRRPRVDRRGGRGRGRRAA